MTITDHLKIAAEKTGVPLRVILGPSRQSDVYRARVLVWARLRDEGYSVSEIGRATNRDHGAVCHGLSKLAAKAIKLSRVEQLERKVAELQGQVAQLLRNEDQFMTEEINR